MRTLSLTVVMMLVLNTAAQSATIYSTVDPLTTDINTLSETLAGGFESNTPDNKNVYAWGLVVPIANQSILSTAVLPINVGPSTGVRLDVFEVPNPLPTRRPGITGGGTVITTNFVHLGSSNIVDPPSQGRQWVSFSFNDIALGDPTKQYLFRISPDQTNGSYVGQQHYWLGLGNVGGMIYDIRYLPINSLVPENTFGEMYSDYAINGGIHLTDVASVPEPMSLALLVTTAGAMLLRRKR